MDDEDAFATRIARFVAALLAAPLEPAVARAVTIRLVDTVGCLLGAADAEPVRIAREVAGRYAGAPRPGAPGASMVGAPGVLPLESAAFVNGIAARFLDFNDIYLSKEAVHPSDNIPVALAFAEGFGRDGAALLRAILAGYEVHCRLADTVSTRAGRWDNVVLGAIAASVMAGSLMGLSIEQQAQAIAVVACSNVALMESRVGALTMWKAAAASYAGKAGAFAALHAAQGMTGPLRALDGTHGLFAQVTGPSDPAFFMPGDREFRVEHVHLKAYPAQYFTQPAIDAALGLRGPIGSTPIRHIRVETFEFGRVAAADTPEKWQPRTRETADHSMPYCVAVALLDGTVGEHQFALSRIRADDVAALMQRIEVVEEPELNALYPGQVPACLRIELADGRVLEARVDNPLGHRLNPMSEPQVLAKATSLAELGGIGAGIAEALWQVEALDGKALAALLSQLRAPA